MKFKFKSYSIGACAIATCLLMALASCGKPAETPAPAASEVPAATTEVSPLVTHVEYNGVSVDVLRDTIVTGDTTIAKLVSTSDPQACAKQCIDNAQCTGFTESSPGVGQVQFGMCTLYGGVVKIEQKAQFSGNSVNRGT